MSSFESLRVVAADMGDTESRFSCATFFNSIDVAVGSVVVRIERRFSNWARASSVRMVASGGSLSGRTKSLETR